MWSPGDDRIDCVGNLFDFSLEILQRLTFSADVDRETFELCAVLVRRFQCQAKVAQEGFKIGLC